MSENKRILAQILFYHAYKTKLISNSAFCESIQWATKIWINVKCLFLFCPLSTFTKSQSCVNPPFRLYIYIENCSYATQTSLFATNHLFYCHRGPRDWPLCMRCVLFCPFFFNLIRSLSIFLSGHVFRGLYSSLLEQMQWQCFSTSIHWIWLIYV